MNSVFDIGPPLVLRRIAHFFLIYKVGADEALTEEICSGTNKKTSYSEQGKNSLYDGNEKYIRLRSTIGSSSSKKQNGMSTVLEKIKKSEFLLGDIFNIDTGIQTGADKVSKKHLEKYKLSSKKDDGIFVLNKQEVKALGLSKKESDEIIKPFFKNSNIENFRCDTQSSEYLIYLDKRLFDFNKVNPSLKKHINKFREVIDNSVCSPPYLHRPRRNEMFTDPKIVVPQRSKLNTFGYNDVDWYASCDVYFITQSDKAALDLKYVLGVMNSKLYFCWLYFMGKRKGEALELYQKPLSEVPIKDVDIKVQGKVIKLAENLIHGHDESSWKRLNEAVYDIYGLSESEIKLVESLYEEKSKSNVEANEDSEEQAA